MTPFIVLAALAILASAYLPSATKPLDPIDVDWDFELHAEQAIEVTR